MKNDDYHLNLNDIIKLGRVKYAINEIKIDATYDVKLEENNNLHQKSEDVYNIEKLNSGTYPVFNFIYEADYPEMVTDDIACKFCYSSSNDLINPLINICSICTGGLKYTHYECLKMFMKTKLIIKANDKKTVKSYNIKAYNCELCKTPYPCNIFRLFFILN